MRRYLEYMLGEFKRLLLGIQLKVACQNWNLRRNQVPVSAALTPISTPGSTSWQCSFTYQSQMPQFGPMGLSWHLFPSTWSLWQLQAPTLRPLVHLLVEVDCSFLCSLRSCRKFWSSRTIRSLKASIQSRRFTNGVQSIHNFGARHLSAVGSSARMPARL